MWQKWITISSILISGLITLSLTFVMRKILLSDLILMKKPWNRIFKIIKIQFYQNQMVINYQAINQLKLLILIKCWLDMLPTQLISLMKFFQSIWWICSNLNLMQETMKKKKLSKKTILYSSIMEKLLQLILLSRTTLKEKF